MRTKILAPLAVVAVALTASSTSSAQQAPSSAPPPQGASASATFSTSGMSASSSGPSRDGDEVKKTILPFVVGGLGAAQLVTGIVLVAAAPSMPDNCSAGTRTCTRLPGQSDASFKQNQQDAGNAQQMTSWGLIGIGSGSVFLLAGAAMYLWYNRDVTRTASSKPLVMPYANANGGGLAAVATF